MQAKYYDSQFNKNDGIDVWVRSSINYSFNICTYDNFKICG